MTAAELIAAWSERDQRYALRRFGGRPSPLSEAESKLVREEREREVNRLPPTERGRAWRELLAWRPPSVTVFHR